MIEKSAIFENLANNVSDRVRDFKRNQTQAALQEYLKDPRIQKALLGTVIGGGIGALTGKDLMSSIGKGVVGAGLGGAAGYFIPKLLNDWSNKNKLSDEMKKLQKDKHDKELGVGKYAPATGAATRYVAPGLALRHEIGAMTTKRPTLWQRLIGVNSEYGDKTDWERLRESWSNARKKQAPLKGTYTTKKVPINIIGKSGELFTGKLKATDLKDPSTLKKLLYKTMGKGSVPRRLAPALGRSGWHLGSAGLKSMLLGGLFEGIREMAYKPEGEQETLLHKINPANFGGIAGKGVVRTLGKKLSQGQ